LEKFYRTNENGKTVEEAVLTQAEAVMNRLTKEEWKTLDRFLDEINERNSREMSYLYICGLKDGLRAMKFINSL